MDQNYALPRRAKDYRQMAWQALKTVWGIAIVVALVAGLLTSGGGVHANLNINLDGNDITDLPQAFEVMQNIMSSPAFVTAASISSLLGLVSFIIGGPIQVGYARFRLKITRGEHVEFKDLFSGFDVFGEAFLLNLRIILRTLGWTLLFVIPGIIAAYRYSQAFFVMAENPALSSGECIERSKAMMAGNKWKLFCLQLSFIGWFFLCILTFGIGFLWLSPFVAVAEAFFFRDVNFLATRANPQWVGGGQQQGYTPPQQDNDDFWKNW